MTAAFDKTPKISLFAIILILFIAAGSAWIIYSLSDNYNSQKLDTKTTALNESFNPITEVYVSESSSMIVNCTEIITKYENILLPNDFRLLWAMQCKEYERLIDSNKPIPLYTVTDLKNLHTCIIIYDKEYGDCN